MYLATGYKQRYHHTLGVYGDVIRVKILYNKRDSALIQFKEPQQIHTCEQHYSDVHACVHVCACVHVLLYNIYTCQERIIKRGGGGGACNFRRFWTGQNNPPVLHVHVFIEHSFALEILIAWQDSVYARVRVYVPYSSYNGKFWMC